MQSSVVVFYSGKHVSFFSWVQVACPRLSIDWGYAFPKPLLSPYEVRNLLFHPIKIRLLRTSCCQILAIYSIVKGDHPPRSRSLALTPTCLLVPARQGRVGETLGTRMDGHVVIMMSTYVRVSLRIKHFRLVSE